MGDDQLARQGLGSVGLMESARNSMALLFTFMFLTFAVFLTVLAGLRFMEVFSSQREMVETLIKAINLGIIGLAIFELAVSIHREHLGRHHHEDFFCLLRRGVARFVGMVCIALVMEGLIMAIKYSQLDLAGNLDYAVAIIISAAALLAALGLFLKLSDPAPLAASQPSPRRRQRSTSPVA
jgi:uncharacterized protein YacL